MKKLQKKLRILTLVLAAGLLFSSVTMTVEAFIQKQGTVNEAVTLRQNAESGATQVMELTSGQQVKVNNELTDSAGTKWYQVFVNETTIGYVPASTITITGNASGSNTTTGDSGATVTMQTVTVTERVGTVTATGAVRVRAQATTSSDHIASMQPNDTFLVLEDANGADGYVWHQIEFDDNGTTVKGYVRSDLVSVKEVTREEQVPVESTDTSEPTVEQPAEAPYSITSQVNAEGTTVWYLVDSATGDTKEISSLLAPQEVKTSNNGVYKIIVVVLLILVILAAAAATFFYMRWQDAEAFIYELREKQARAKKQTSPVRTAPAKQTVTQQTGSKPAVNKPTTPSAKPTGTTTSKLPPVNNDSAKVTVKPVTQPIQSTVVKPEASKPAQSTVAPKTEPVKTEQPTVKPVVQPEVKAEEKPAAQPEVKPARAEKKEVIPNTADIVNATKKELQSKQTAPTASTKSNGWKSKNFLTDDDDLEFDFLDMDDK